MPTPIPLQDPTAVLPVITVNTGWDESSAYFQGPWEANGAYYMVSAHRLDNGTDGWMLWIFKTTDFLTFTPVDSANGPDFPLQVEGQAFTDVGICTAYRQGNTLYFAYAHTLDPSPTLGTIHLTTFSLATETWGSTSDSGALPYHDRAVISLAVTSTGTVVIFFETTTQYTMAWISFSGGVWSGASVFDAFTIGTPFVTGGLWPCVADSSNKIHLLYCLATSNTGFEIKYVRWSAGSVSSPVVAGTGVVISGNLLNIFGTARYDAVNDIVLFPVTIPGGSTFGAPTNPFPNSFSLVKVTGASGGSPAVSSEGVADIADPNNDFWSDSSFCISPDGLTYRGFTQKQDVITVLEYSYQLLEWTRPASGGSWAGPTVLWDSQVDPPIDSQDVIRLFPPGLGPVQLSAGPKSGAIATLIGLHYVLGGDTFLNALVVGGLTVSLSCPVTSPSFGVPYSQPLVVGGGTAPFTFAIIGGSLPAGLTLNASTGVISGTASSFDPYSYTAQVTDANSLTAQTTCTGAFGPPQPPAPEVCIPNPVSTYTVDLKSYNEPKELNGS